MASPSDIIKNLKGTFSSLFSIGKGGPTLSQVAATARLLLPPLLRFVPTSGATDGDLATDGSGDVRVIKHNLTAILMPAVTNDSTQGYEVGSRWFDQVTQSVWTCLDASVGAAVWVMLSPSTPTYGGNYAFAESLGFSSTISSTFQNKVTLVTPVVPAGTYRVGWSYAWGYSSSSSSFRGRVRVNGSDVATQEQEPKDSSASEVHPASGFATVVLASGSQTITIDYCSESFGNTARIQNARLEFWRVV